MTQIRILVIEDEKLINRCLKQALETMGGYAVHCAFTGLDAIGLLSDEHYDVIITDLHLPDYKNFELVREIRGLNQDVPLIVMSAYCPEASEDDIREHGVFRCINKPFEIEDILTGVEAALIKQMCEADM